MSLLIHQSNKLERLADILARNIAADPPDPFGRETFLVLSKGMEKWLSLELAERLGVWANGEFLFPNRLVHRLVEALVPEEERPDTSLFEKEILTWRIMRLLPGLLSEKAFAPVAAYLGGGARPSGLSKRQGASLVSGEVKSVDKVSTGSGDADGESGGIEGADGIAGKTEASRAVSRGTAEADPPSGLRGAVGVRLYQLACRLADTYDQYAVYRPGLLEEWERGGERDDWQARLWRILIEDAAGGCGRTALHDRLFSRLAGGGGELKAALPRRLSVFGVSTLPPVYLDLLSGLSTHLPVHIYFLNPSRGYWGDILSRKESARLAVKEGAPADARAGLFLDEGNPLLGSLGKEGRDFLSLLVDFDGGEGVEAFEDPGEEDMLHALRKDILELRERGSPGERRSAAPAERLQVREDDRSIQIHVCHGPAREIEVLHDRLLDMFDTDPGLEPRDIVVMAPDIEEYAPYVEAVFGAGRAGGAYIPFSIADRGESAGDRVFDGFSAILDLAGGRFGAGAVLDALEIEPVRKRAGFTEKEMELVRHWISELRIRWGMDGRHRESLGLPGFEENTWRAGLDRLLLGYVFPAAGEAGVFRGVLPFGDVEGDGAVTAGKLAGFTGKLRKYARRLETARDPAAWRDLLTGIVDDFLVEDDDTTSSVQSLRRVVSGLATRAAGAGFDALLDKAAIQAFLGDELGVRGSTAGFLTGRVTFCSMLPMRSIPFLVVCLLGLSDTAFPRTRRLPGFNRLSEKPRPGDRSMRDDDRYQFLEAILSARRRLYISYTGRSIRDNSAIPPSPVVDELKDYIARGFASASGDILSGIETVHPLHPFDAACFDGSDPSLFSYSAAHCIPAAARGAARVIPFQREPLPPPPGDEEEGPLPVDAAAFIRFFKNPAAAYLRERLGVSFPSREPEIPESEPFAVEGLDRYSLEDELLQARLEGVDPADLLPLARASGELPHGIQGEAVFREHADIAAAIAASVPFRDDSDPEAPAAVETACGGLRITGTVGELWRDRASGALLRVVIRPAAINGKDFIDAWIKHLLLNEAAAAGSGAVTGSAVGSATAVSSAAASRSAAAAGTAAGGDAGVTTFLTGWERKSGRTDIRRFKPLAEPGPFLDVLAGLFMEGKLRPLPFFPRTSCNFAAGVNKDPAEASRAERMKGRKGAFSAWKTSFTGSPGESDDRAIATCFRDADPLDEEFERMAWTVFAPILDNSEKVRGIVV